MSYSIKAYTLVLFLCFLSPQFLRSQESADTTFKIAFGSCNRVDKPNPFWEDIAAHTPDVFIWGGDVIYADTRKMKKMKAMYQLQKDNPGYKAFAEKIPILGTWDDHDYGLNDGGADYIKKQKSQQLFLDFLEVPEDDSNRKTEGVYTSKTYKQAGKTLKIIILDTRYFRSPLKPAVNPNKRYEPDTTSGLTFLGEKQWKWLENELQQEADFVVIMSSIQFLSAEHGFETWGNFPKEVSRFEELIKTSKAKGILFLSGDRHISEFSLKNVEGLNYPLIDFTSSGLTHSYTSYTGESNQYRVGELVSVRSYGLVDIDLITREVSMEIIGVGGEVLGQLKQVY